MQKQTEHMVARGRAYDAMETTRGFFLSNYLRQSLGQQTLNFDISLAQVKINDKLTIRLDIFSILADGSNYEAILQFHRFHYSEYLVHIHN